MFNGAPHAFVSAVILATMVESLLEYVVGIWWTPLQNEQRKKVVLGIGLVLGIALAMAYKVDLIAAMGLQPSIIGQLLSGALIGRGSSYVHDFVAKWSRCVGGQSPVK